MFGGVLIAGTIPEVVDRRWRQTPSRTSSETAAPSMPFLQRLRLTAVRGPETGQNRITFDNPAELLSSIIHVNIYAISLEEMVMVKQPSRSDPEEATTEEKQSDSINRRKVLRTGGAAVGSGLLLGVTGTAAATEGKPPKNSTSANNHKHTRDNKYHGGNKGPQVNKQHVDTGDATVTIFEIDGKTFMFRVANSYDDSKGVSTQSTYGATESGYPLEFGEVSQSVSASDFNRDSQLSTQAVDVTLDNFVENWYVEYDTISNSCGDIAFSNHNAFEMHLDGGGALSAIGVGTLSGLVCAVIAASSAVPTAGWGAIAGGAACSGLATVVDQAIDVEMIPNETEMTLAIWDEDEEYPFGLNTSPTIRAGMSGGYHDDWDEMWNVDEFDANVHMPG